MRVGKQQTTLSEPIDVRRLNLGMSTQAANPVIHVIDNDHQDVRLFHAEA
jgi:hypothetical protein